jgi:hypothetical protein
MIEVKQQMSNLSYVKFQGSIEKRVTQDRWSLNTGLINIKCNVK